VGELAGALAHHGATFFSYVFSFLMLGVLWFRNNQTYRHFHHITKTMLALHLLQLAMAAFFPFSAALLGRYPTNPLVMVIYSGCVMLYAWAFLAEWVTAKVSGAIEPSVNPMDYKRQRRRSIRGCVIVTAIFVASLLNAFVFSGNA
jgi:uncharacterized membrane protein